MSECATPETVLLLHCSKANARMSSSGYYLSTQSESLDVKLDAGASWPPIAYKKPFQVVTPTPPLLFDI